MAFMNFRPSNFYYPVSGVEAERLLNTYGNEGSFLARPSGSSPSDYTLSVHRGNKITHIKIQNNGDFLDLFGGETFASLSELVQYYVENPRQLRERDGEIIFMKCSLLVPLTERIGWMISRPMSERWFHTGISGKEAEYLLSEGKHGTFLVRESQSTPGQFAISVKAADDKVIHVMIYNKNNKFDIGGGATFSTIGELLDHYGRNPMVDQTGTVVHLKQHLPSTRLPASGIDDRFQRLEIVDRTTGKDGFAEEFEKLQHQEPTQFISRREGKKAENVNKNRYKNIIPYDHTRIILENVENSDASDYINANHIEILYKEYPEFAGIKRKYISTQGCLPNTINDFWTMVWQQKTEIIVMTTKEIERGRSKCCRYWPLKDEEEKYGRDSDLIVKFLQETEFPDYTLREFQLFKVTENGDTGSPRRHLWHFQFLGWPDHGCPTDPGTVLRFLEKVNECDEKNCIQTGPIIVHCSAGIGRTGTFIVIDILLNQIKRIGSHCQIDIPRTVQMIREQRSGMVQTEQQYRFVYQAVSFYMKTLNQKQDFERRERCSSRYSNRSGSVSTPKTPTTAPLTPLSFAASPILFAANVAGSGRSIGQNNDSDHSYLNTSEDFANAPTTPPLKLAPPPLPKKRITNNSFKPNQ